MKKNLLLTISAILVLTAAFAGCSKNDETAAVTEAPTEAAATSSDPVINLYDEYQVADGDTLYESEDGSFSIHLPEGSTIDDSDPDNVTINIASDYENPDLINISKTVNGQKIASIASLMEMLKSDNSIDVTGFFVLQKGGTYEGYKYTYVSVDNADLKGIVSVFFADDNSAYTVNATINNGSDEDNVTKVNAIVDSFVSNI